MTFSTYAAHIVKDVAQTLLKNEKYLKNLSDNTLTDHQVSVLANNP